MSIKTNKKLILKTWVRVILIIALCFLFALSTGLIYFGKHPIKRSSTPIYYYGGNSNIDYKVYLLPNDFYEDKYLGMDKQYTTALIDYIDINMNYLFNGSLKSDIAYSYDVTASIIGEYENTTNGKAELWTKKYVLLDEQNMEMKDTTYFNINQNIKINYNDYNNVVTSFKEQFKIAIDAYLNVKLTVKYNSDIIDNDNSVNDENNFEINIPLATNTMKITTNNVSGNKSLTKEEMVKENTIMIYCGFILLGITTILFIILIIELFKNSKSQYKINLNRIMKDYSEIIAEVTSPMDYNNKTVLEIKNFDDLVDIEEEIKSPILYYEIEHNRESWFIITTEEYIYKYVLSIY